MAPVVHLATAEAPAARPLPVLTRISLAELALLHDRLGSPPLPLDLDDGGDDDEPASRLHDRLHDRLNERLAAGTPSTAQRARGLVGAAFDRARCEPAATAARLIELGLLDDHGTPVGDVVAAFGVLAGPEALLVLDLALSDDGGPARLRSWFAIAGTQVAQLSTASGLIFELAWYDVAGLPDALTRAATVDAADDADDDDDSVDQLGGRIELPFELFTDGTEAVRRGRADLLAELVRIAPAPVRLDGAEAAPVAAAAVVTALEQASRGRLRVLVTAAQGGASRRTVGVISWLRVGSGWRSLTPLTLAGVPTVVVAEVSAAHLARAVAPVLAEVVR